MNALANLFRSTIGKKVLMAGTGTLMFVWLLIHTVGNMLVFVGQESFNHYAEFIQSGFGVEPGLLWLMRLVMLSAIAGHIWSAMALTQRNRAARPVAYAGGRKDRATSYAAKFMMLGGLVLLAFLAFHLAHLTVGVFSDDAIQSEAFVRHDPYRNLVVGLSNPVVALFYIVANLALAAHLRHGVVSGMQTLGLNHPRYESTKKGLGLLLPLAIAGGNILIATGVLLGIPAAPV